MGVGVGRGGGRGAELGMGGHCSLTNCDLAEVTDALGFEQTNFILVNRKFSAIHRCEDKEEYHTIESSGESRAEE